MPSFVLSKLAPHVSEPDFVHEMLKNGKDPKDKLISHCSNHCTYWKDKLTKCETKLDQVIKVNPSKSCMYPRCNLVQIKFPVESYFVINPPNWPLLVIVIESKVIVVSANPPPIIMFPW